MVSPPRLPARQSLRINVSRVWSRLIHKPICTLLARIQLWCWGADVSSGLAIAGRIRLHVRGRLQIGRDVVLNSGAANYVGGDRRLAIWVGKDATVVIGDRCRLSNSTILSTQSIEILPETFIGGGCNLYDTDFHHLDAQGRLDQDPGAAPHAAIRIGPRAFVGGHVTILKGVTIGEGAVIGAGSVVTKSVPPGEIWAGVPARFVRNVEGTPTRENLPATTD